MRLPVVVVGKLYESAEKLAEKAIHSIKRADSFWLNEGPQTSN